MTETDQFDFSGLQGAEVMDTLDEQGRSKGDLIPHITFKSGTPVNLRFLSALKVPVPSGLPGVITIQVHSNVPTGPAPEKATNWPAKMWAPCLADEPDNAAPFGRAFPEGCRFCQMGGEAASRKKRTFGLAVIQKEQNGEWVDATRKVKRGDEEIEVPAYGLVGQARYGFWDKVTIASGLSRNNLTQRFQISRTGEGQGTVYRPEVDLPTYDLSHPEVFAEHYPDGIPSLTEVLSHKADRADLDRLFGKPGEARPSADVASPALEKFRAAVVPTADAPTDPAGDQADVEAVAAKVRERINNQNVAPTH